MNERNWGNLIVLLYTGRIDEAIAKLRMLLQQNGDLSIELLKKDPFWDPLRDIEAFKLLVESHDKKTSLNE